MAKRGIRFNFREKARLQLTPGEGGSSLGAELVAYGIDADDFYLRGIAADGTIIWNHWGFEVEDEYPQFVDSIYSWPGYGGGMATSRGYFVQMMDQVAGATGNGFFHVDFDGTPVSGVMEIPRNVTTGWGQAIIEDANGDHYATYFYDIDDNDVLVVGWNGIETEKWRVMRPDLPNPPEDWISAGGLALSPDGSVLVALFVFGYLIGIDTATGSVLWEYQTPDADYVMDQCNVVAFDSSGRLLYIGDEYHADDDVGTIFGVAATLWALDFPSGYFSAPIEAWKVNLQDTAVGDSEPFGMAMLDDGSVVLNYGYWPGGLSHADDELEQGRLARVSNAGAVLWDIDVATEKPGYRWEVYYSPLVRVGSYVYASVLNMDIGFGDYNNRYHLTRWSIENGSLSEIEELPVGGWAIGLAAIPTVGVESLITYDGLPLTTYDGEPLTTWET